MSIAITAVYTSYRNYKKIRYRHSHNEENYRKQRNNTSSIRFTSLFEYNILFLLTRRALASSLSLSQFLLINVLKPIKLPVQNPLIQLDDSQEVFDTDFFLTKVCSEI